MCRPLSNDHGDYHFDLDKVYNAEGYVINLVAAVAIVGTAPRWRGSVTRANTEKDKKPSF